MSILIINNQKISDLQPDLLTRFHGTSVFTTMRSSHKKILLWEQHWRRLSIHACYFNFFMPDYELVYKLINHELEKKSCDQKIRIIISAHDWALSLENYEAPQAYIYSGVKICISHFMPHPQLGVFKTSNSLPYMLAAREAHEQGVFEALLLNADGYLCDGSRTSIMVFDGEQLISCQGGLEGCMRQEVLAYAQKIGIKTCEKFIQFPQKGQMLLANSLIGVVSVGPIIYSLCEQIVNRFRMDHDNS